MASARLIESLSLCARRVLFALAYTDQFSYPLTLHELFKRTPGNHTTVEITAALTELLAHKWIEQSNTYYSLPSEMRSTTAQKIVETRRQRFLESKQLRPAIREAVDALSSIPFIQAIALTGSLSMETAQPGDDIDFCIITSPGTLWVSRLWAVLLASSKGRRRFWWEDQTWLAQRASSNQLGTEKLSRKKSNNEKTKWCLNLWLTTKALAVPEQQRSIYTAYEVAQAKFVFSRSGTATAFLQANSWVKNYLPRYWQTSLRALNLRKSQTLGNNQNEDSITTGMIALSTMFKGIIVGLNQIFYWAQRWYMVSHMTQEKVGLDMAYFHPRPTAKLITQGWQVALQRVVSLQKEDIKKKPTTKPTKSKVKSVPMPVDADPIESGLLPTELQDKIEKIRQQGQAIVLVTGVFDILHRAHRQFLIQAKMQGDFLVVGIESDTRVSTLKGPGRPVNTASKRQKQIEALEIVDAVFVLPEQFSNREDHINLIKAIKPKVLAVSANTPHVESKQAILAQVGGRVEVVMEHDKSISTTQLIEQMKA